MARDNINPVSRAFRSAAGLPERKDEKTLSNGEASGAKLSTEPEGGYGGKDGIKNTGAINSAEETGQAKAERQAKADAERAKAETKKAPAKKAPAKKVAAKKEA